MYQEEEFNFFGMWIKKSTKKQQYIWQQEAKIRQLEARCKVVLCKQLGNKAWEKFIQNARTNNSLYSHLLALAEKGILADIAYKEAEEALYKAEDNELYTEVISKHVQKRFEEAERESIALCELLDVIKPEGLLRAEEVLHPQETLASLCVPSNFNKVEDNVAISLDKAKTAYDTSFDFDYFKTEWDKMFLEEINVVEVCDIDDTEHALIRYNNACLKVAKFKKCCQFADKAKEIARIASMEAYNNLVLSSNSLWEAHNNIATAIEL